MRTFKPEWQEQNRTGLEKSALKQRRDNVRAADMRPQTYVVYSASILLLALILLISWSSNSLAMLAAQNAEITWSARASNHSDAASAQDSLFLTLYNTGRLPLKRVVMNKGEYPGDTLRRAGAWIGNLSATSDALLCDLNPKICTRVRRSASSREQRRDTSHLAGFRVGGATRWVASIGDKLVIPDIQIIQIYRQENGGSFPTSTDTLINAEQVSRVPACLDNAGKICVTDYQFDSQGRSSDENNLRPVIKVLPRFSKNTKDAFALVPHLTARLSIPENQISYYGRLPKAGKYSFDDPGYKRLLIGIGDNIQGKFAGAIKSLPEGEPKFQLQKDFFEQFFNVARHGKPRPHENGFPITIVVIDHKPNIEHCDFEAARIEMLREPGTFDEPGTAAVAVSAASDTGDGADDNCDISESPWLREFHGTHILGLAAARRNNRGGAGLLSHFDNVSFKVIPINIDRLRGDENYVAELAVSIREAIFDHGAKIINLSWAYTPVDGGGQRDDIRELIEQTKNSVVWFAAAGNEGINANNGVCNTRPACFSHPNVAGIVAVERTQDGTGFQLLGEGTETNIGWQSFDLAAPGRNIWSTVGHHEMAAASGTSQSTIIATSAAALVMSKENLRPRDVIERLVYTSSIIPALKHGMNGGIVDATAALKFEQDQLWLTDGCAYSGRATRLRFKDGNDLKPGDFSLDTMDPVTGDSLGAVHFNLDETKRLFFDEQNDSYIGFFVRSGASVLRRVSGDYSTVRATRILRFQIASSRGENCQAAPGRLDVSVDKIKDFIRKSRS